MAQVTYHVTSQHNKHVKDDHFFMCAESRFGCILFAEVIASEFAQKANKN